MDTVRENMRDEIDRPSIKEVDLRVGMAAAIAVAIVAVGVGFVIYRGRRRLSLARRLQHALPDVDDIRASIKKPLERVVNAL